MTKRLARFIVFIIVATITLSLCACSKKEVQVYYAVSPEGQLNQDLWIECDEGNWVDSNGDAGKCEVDAEGKTVLFKDSQIIGNLADGVLTMTEGGVYVADATRAATTVVFGSYPQTMLSEENQEQANIIQGLNAEIAEPTYSWTSFGYRQKYTIIERSLSGSNWIAESKSSAINNIDMSYVDVTYQGQKYRGVVFSEYRTGSTVATYGVLKGNSYIPNQSGQVSNQYVKSKVYWFRYESITWTVLDGNYNGTGKSLLLSNLILDSQSMHEAILGNASSYEESSIRAWLNENFYNTAFSESEQSAIVATDNHLVVSAGADNVFILSKEDLSRYSAIDDKAELPKRNSDYAKVQGCFSYDGMGCWWLRPTDTDTTIIQVTQDGAFIYNVDPDATSVGVVPVIVK